MSGEPMARLGDPIVALSALLTARGRRLRVYEDGSPVRQGAGVAAGGAVKSQLAPDSFDFRFDVETG